jgi:hypothetical protein
VGDSRRLGLQAREPARGALDERQRGAARSAGDVEDGIVLAETQEVAQRGLLGGAAPALLAEVLAVDLGPQLPGRCGLEAGVQGPVEGGAALGGALVLPGQDLDLA